MAKELCQCNYDSTKEGMASKKLYDYINLIFYVGK